MMSGKSALSPPEFAAAFDRMVDLFITANEREEAPLMARAYSELAWLASLSGVERDLLWARDHGLKVPDYVLRAFRDAVELARVRQASA